MLWWGQGSPVLLLRGVFLVGALVGEQIPRSSPFVQMAPNPRRTHCAQAQQSICTRRVRSAVAEGVLTITPLAVSRSLALSLSLFLPLFLSLSLSLRLSSDDDSQETSARYRAEEPSSGSNVIPRRARPGLAGLRPHTSLSLCQVSRSSSWTCARTGTLRSGALPPPLGPP